MKHNGGPGYQAGRNAKRPRPDGPYNNDRNPNKRARDQRDHSSAATGANAYPKKDTNAAKFQDPDLWKHNGEATSSATTLQTLHLREHHNLRPQLHMPHLLPLHPKQQRPPPALRPHR